MKLVLVILVVLVVAVSLLADYKWRQWMAARKFDRQDPRFTDPSRRHHR